MSVMAMLRQPPAPSDHGWSWQRHTSPVGEKIMRELVHTGLRA